MDLKQHGFNHIFGMTFFFIMWEIIYNMVKCYISLYILSKKSLMDVGTLLLCGEPIVLNSAFGDIECTTFGV